MRGRPSSRHEFGRLLLRGREAKVKAILALGLAGAIREARRPARIREEKIDDGQVSVFRDFPSNAEVAEITCPQPASLADVTRRLFSPMIRYRSCHSVGPLDGDTCTAVTLYSGQLVAQSELSVVTTLVWHSG